VGVVWTWNLQGTSFGCAGTSFCCTVGVQYPRPSMY